MSCIVDDKFSPTLVCFSNLTHQIEFTLDIDIGCIVYQMDVGLGHTQSLHAIVCKYPSVIDSIGYRCHILIGFIGDDERKSILVDRTSRGDAGIYIRLGHHWL